MLAGATGCSAGSADETGPGSAAEKRSPDATTEATAGVPQSDRDGHGTDDEQHLRTLHDDFWSALVELENGDQPDPALFDGVATDGVAEEEVSRVRPARASGHTREGAPEVGEATIEMDGDEALIQACVDPEGWLLFRHGEAVDLDTHGASPSVVAAERTTDGWLISATGLYQRATITC